MTDGYETKSWGNQRLRAENLAGEEIFFFHSVYEVNKSNGNYGFLSPNTWEQKYEEKALKDKTQVFPYPWTEKEIDIVPSNYFPYNLPFNQTKRVAVI